MNGEGQENDPWSVFAAERDEVIGTVSLAVLAVMLGLSFGLLLLLVF